MKPLISVIIPAHNNEATIGDAISSMINQTWKELEILVIDDNSTDNTKNVVLDYVKKDARVFYHSLPFDDPNRINKRGRNINAGYMARNYGFEKVKGDYITFQDADDASFLNRIEAQYELLVRHNATHVTLDWQTFDSKLVGKKFNIKQFMEDNKNLIVRPDELVALAQESKGIFLKLLPKFAPFVDFEIKRLRVINKLFFGSLESYPGTGNSPLFRREVIEQVQFRKLADRVWPSFMGRGADRDFNLQVAETYKNSYVFFIPMYMWRVNRPNDRYQALDSYIIT